MAPEDTILFGSRNVVIADEFADLVEAALVQGVASLPLMNEDDGGIGVGNDQEEQEESRSDKMLKKLRKVYYRNVDLAEIYAGRNIFSLRNRTRLFRERVVKAFLAKQDETENNSGKTGKDETATKAERKNANSILETKHPFPASKQDIPTQEMQAALERELTDLHAKLREARKQKLERLRHCKDIEQEVEFADETSKTLEKNSNLENVPKNVQAMQEGKVELERLQSKGKNLIEKMDNEKRERMNDENENNNNNLPDVVPKKAKIMTMEEDYMERRNVLGPIQGNDLSKVKSLLKSNR